MSEWELLQVAEGIEPGDTIEVENEDGDIVLMVYKTVKKGAILLVDQSRKTHRFSAQNLESMDDSSYIVGKSDEELSLG